MIYNKDEKTGELYHYGVKGQRWGIRRYQNEDGTYTAEGAERRRIGNGEKTYKIDRVKSSRNVPEDIASDAAKVNYSKQGHKYGINRQSNCVFCSVAYEMRRRGMDVSAQPSLRGVQAVLSNNKSAMRKIYTNFDSKKVKTFSDRIDNKNIGMTDKEFDEFEKELLNDGNSRGQITLCWRASDKGGNVSGAHSLCYEVKDGKMYLIDGQIGAVMSDKKARKYLSNAINIDTMRTDNLKLNEKAAKKMYTQDASAGFDENKYTKKAEAATLSTLLTMPLNAIVPYVPLAISAGVASYYSKKAQDLDNEKSLELEELWKKEGRYKEGWYNIYQDEKEKKK